MTENYQNLADYIEKSGTKIIHLYREFMNRGGNISFTRFNLWCHLDGRTQDEKSLKILSEITGISADNLFVRSHEVH